jgi:hypothetical protein
MKNNEIKDLETYCSEVEIVSNTLDCSIEQAENLINGYPDLDISMLLARGFHNQSNIDAPIYDGAHNQMRELKKDIEAIKQQQL